MKPHEKYAEEIVEHFRPLCTYELQYGKEYFDVKAARKEAIYVIEKQIDAIVEIKQSDAPYYCEKYLKAIEYLKSK